MPDPIPQVSLDKCHLDFAWKTHEYIHNYIRFADTKAAFVFAWASSLIGALFITRSHRLFLHSEEGGTPLVAVLSAVAFILLALSVTSAVWVIIPRLFTRQLAGLVFWGSIRVHATDDLYARALMRESESALTEHLLVQVYAVAGIAEKKYWWTGVSIALAFLGSTAAAAVLLLKHPAAPGA
jgi:hypothetical protein